MPTLTTTVFLLIIGYFILNILYFHAVCVYRHTRLRYQLFALRDRFRRIRIENAMFDRRLYDLMELRLNGSIGLVPYISVFKILYVRWFMSFSNEDKKVVKEMENAIDILRQNQNDMVAKSLYEIEIDRKQILRSSVECNSPYFTCVAWLIVCLLPFVIRGIQRLHTSAEKTMQPMMVKAARHVQLAQPSLRPVPFFQKVTAKNSEKRHLPSVNTLEK